MSDDTVVGRPGDAAINRGMSTTRPVQVERRFVIEVVIALESSAVIGARSCRPGDGLDLGNLERLAAEGRSVLAATSDDFGSGSDLERWARRVIASWDASTPDDIDSELRLGADVNGLRDALEGNAAPPDPSSTEPSTPGTANSESLPAAVLHRLRERALAGRFDLDDFHAMLRAIEPDCGRTGASQ